MLAPNTHVRGGFQRAVRATLLQRPLDAEGRVRQNLRRFGFPGRRQAARALAASGAWPLGAAAHLGGGLWCYLERVGYGAPPLAARAPLLARVRGCLALGGGRARGYAKLRLPCRGVFPHGAAPPRRRHGGRRHAVLSCAVLRVTNARRANRRNLVAGRVLHDRARRFRAQATGFGANLLPTWCGMCRARAHVQGASQRRRPWGCCNPWHWHRPCGRCIPWDR